MNKEELFIIRRKGLKLKTPYHLINQIIKKINNGYSVFVAVCGEQRTGKSFFAVWLLFTFYSIFKKDYDPTKNTFYDAMDVLRNFEQMTQEGILIDEASDILDKRDWAAKTHKAITSMINIEGFHNNLFVIICPFISELDSRVGHHLSFVVWVKKKKKKQYSEWIAWKRIKKFYMSDPKNDKFSKVLEMGHLLYDAVPQYIWEKYEKYSKEQKTIIHKKHIEELLKEEKVLKEEKSIIAEYGKTPALLTLQEKING